MYQLPDPLMKEIILAIELDAVMFPGGWLVRLYTNDLTPSKTNVVADFTELTNVQVPGYAPVAGAWQGLPVRKPTGEWEDGGVGPLNYAASANPAAPIVVHGWFATNAAGTVLIGSGRFASPFTFALAGDGFDLEQLIRSSQVDGTDYNLLLDMEQE